jgi:hypothetical protein
MGFNSAFKGLKLFKKNPGDRRLNNLNDPVLNVLKNHFYENMSFLMVEQTSETDDANKHVWMF